jgi:hypothetical protein
LNGTSPVFTKALDFLFHPDHSMIIRTKLNNEHIEDVQFVFEYETEIDRPTEENYLAAAGGLRISKIVDFDNVSGEFPGGSSNTISHMMLMTMGLTSLFHPV